MLNPDITPERPHEDIWKIAGVCHETNKAFCELANDMSQVPWTAAPQWQRDSAYDGVKAVYDDPNLNDSALHDKWLESKVADGWIYGEKKDPNAVPPTHPCIGAFEDLPPHQQYKDILFLNTARTLIEYFEAHGAL